jgi:hypothetical protein
MDILNWLYLAKNKFVRTTLGSTKDLMIFGSKVGFNKRGDLYQNYAMSVEDFTASLPAPEPAYKVYTALLTQSGAGNAPVATVLENTIEITPSFAYNNVGQYSIEFPGLFPYAEGFGQVLTFFTTSNSGSFTYLGQTFPSTSYISIGTRAGYTVGPFTAGQLTDGLLSGSIEIRVYN